MSCPDKRVHGARGSALIIVLTFLLMIAGLAVPTLMQGVKTQQATGSGLLSTKLLMVADSGLDYAYSELEKDTLFAVKNQLDFVWNESESAYEWASAQPLLVANQATNQSFHLRVQYWNGADIVKFADRGTPGGAFDRIRVTSTSIGAGIVKSVSAWYAYRFAFRSAIVSDAMPTSNTGSGKNLAKEGHIVFDGEGRLKQHVIHGDLQANGKIVYFENNDGVELTTENANDYLLAFSGKITANLAGTADQIPDFTNPDSQKQLFDFDRFIAAANAGAGKIYNNLTEFELACKNAETDGKPLEGIIVVKIDPGTEGNSPSLANNTFINIRGTLLFDFADGTVADYKVVLGSNVRVHINPADTSGVDLTDESTFTSGYPASYDSVPMPHEVDLTADAFENFKSTDDLPAVMFNNGIVDFHGQVNICGVIYGPAFIEIENKNGQLQYVNGALFGGSGVYLQADSGGAGTIAIRYDPSTTDQLALFENTAAELTRIGYAIVR